MLQATNGKTVPLEIKYGRTNLHGLRALMKRFGIDNAFAVSRDREETLESNGGTITVIPAFKFMLKSLVGRVLRVLINGVNALS